MDGVDTFGIVVYEQRQMLARSFGTFCCCCLSLNRRRCGAVVCLGPFVSVCVLGWASELRSRSFVAVPLQRIIDWFLLTVCMCRRTAVALVLKFSPSVVEWRAPLGGGAVPVVA